MSGSERQHARLLNCAMVSSVISSACLMAAMLVNTEGKNQIPLLIFGVLFWVGLALEQIFFWRSWKLMKEVDCKRKKRLKGRVGILSIGATTEGFAADIVFALALLTFILCEIVKFEESVLQYLLICVIVLSFRMHCILNGKNYRYRKINKKKGRS